MLEDEDSPQLKEIKQQISDLWKNRNNQIDDYFHEVLGIVVDYCIQNDIGTIIIGYNKGWKQNVNMGKINNQNFSTIPFKRLIDRITYKGKLIGIDTIKREESYTSQTCPICGEKSRANRKHRGWFECKNPNCPFKIRFGKPFQCNADVVGAINIGNKERNNLFTSKYIIDYLRQSPKIFKIKYKK